MKGKPKEIDHKHILDSILEVRFKSDSENPFLDILFALRERHNDFKFELNDLPKAIRESSRILKYYPEFKLLSDEYVIAIGNNSISFNCTSLYKKWDNFFLFIKDNLEIVNGLNLITEIERVGIRYVNLFHSQEDIGSILKTNVDLGFRDEDFKMDQIVVRSSLRGEKISANILVADKSTVENKNLPPGILFDIDVYVDQNLPNEVSADLYGVIDEIHNKETDIFFNTLTEDFLESLNPRYK